MRWKRPRARESVAGPGGLLLKYPSAFLYSDFTSAVERIGLATVNRAEQRSKKANAEALAGINRFISIKICFYR
jgi:hypothetical protein